MYRDYLTNKWVLSGVGFLVLFSFSCILWYEYQMAPYKQEATETAELLLQLETPSNIGSEMEQTTDSSALDNTTQKSEIPVTQTRTETANKITGVEVSQEKQTEPSTDKVVESDVRVSPFGFGAYPRIPVVYRDLEGIQDIWSVYEQMAETDPDTARMNELGERVLIKLWEQGLQPTGGKHRNGLFYPDYPNTVYVRWSEEVLEDGSIERFPAALSGDPAFSAYEVAFMESDGAVFPSGWTMLDMQRDRIDPYQYLSWEKK